MFAQENLLRCIDLKGDKAIYFLDSLSVLPASIQCSDSTITFDYDVNTKQISFHQSFDSLKVCYRAFAIDFSDTLFTYAYDTLVDQAILRKTTQQPVNQKETFWETPNLYKSGNISRGISVGNTQNVFVNSNLNLQLDGMLANDVSIRAVISDQNIPVQPEGNTQQIQDFDKVYIQVNVPKTELLAGDVLFESKQGTFLRYARNVQGGKIQYNQSEKLLASGGIALSKGKFTSQQIETLDNVQGPYRLIGPNQERFIIILANSEHVYLDGKLLKRGWDQDYIIDYNQAEVTFMNRVVITKYSRLRIDYEYADRNYVRTNQFAHLNYKTNQLSVDYHYYGENDNEKRPLNISLTEQDKVNLSSIGDNLDKAYISSFDTVSYRPNAILYKVDTVQEAGNKYPVFVYSTNQDTILYEVSFTQVNSQNGDYLKGEVLGNGTNYVWAGKGQGDYLPVRIISTPQKKEMHTVKGSWSIRKKHRAYFETALSHYDQNLYSQLDQKDNWGNAWLVGYEWKDSLKNYQSVFSLEQQRVNQNFQEIDRFRGVDFDRDWNAQTLETKEMQLTKASLGFTKNTFQRFLYETVYRVQDTLLEGFQHTVVANQQLKKWRTENHFFYMNAKQSLHDVNWQRINSKFSYQGKKIVPSVRYVQDYNTIKNLTLNQYQRPQLYLDIWELKMASQDTSTTKFDFNYQYQTSKDTLAGLLVKNEEIQQFQANWKQRFAENKQQLAINSTYRLSLPFIEKSEGVNENVMGQIDWKAKWWYQNIQTHLFYQSQAGRVLKREYLFVEVPIGQGTHIFKDFNENEVQEINEFVEDPLIGNYVQTFVPTDEYINAYDNIFRYKLNFRFPKTWRKGQYLKKLLSRFSYLSIGGFEQKVTDASLEKRFNPLSDVENEFLLSQKQTLKNTLFFNQRSRNFGMTLTQQQNVRKQLLTFGIDSLSLETWRLDTRIRLLRQWNTLVKAKYAVQKKDNNYAQGINYAIEEYHIQPELNYQPSSFVRWTVLGGGKEKINYWSVEKATFWEYGMKISWSKASSQRVDAQLSMLRIFSNQLANNASPISFLILEGLQQGINWRWQLNWQTKIAQGLQLQLEYEGRKPNAQQLVHLGKVQVSALF